MAVPVTDDALVFTSVSTDDDPVASGMSPVMPTLALPLVARLTPRGTYPVGVATLKLLPVTDSVPLAAMLYE